MKDISTFFEDLFTEKNIRDARLGKFATDHLARLIANNPASVFDPIIAATTTVLAAFNNARVQQSSSVGDWRAKTGAKQRARKAFTEFIRQQEGAIRSKFGTESEPYIEFFPNGLTPFGQSGNTRYSLLVNNIVARATQYVADLGIGFKNDATALANAFNNAKDEQITDKGEVANKRATAKTTRADLSAQLTLNVLTVGLQFSRQPEKAQVYFDESLLFAQHRKRLHKGQPTAGTMVPVCNIAFEASKSLQLENKGSVPLVFQLYLMGNPVGNSFTVAPGKTVKKPMDAFFSNGDELRVTNVGSVAGWYLVKEIS